MDFKVDYSEWDALSLPEKNHRLYLRQTRMLETFLKHGAITPTQYSRSLHDLTEKMGERT